MRQVILAAAVLNAASKTMSDVKDNKVGILQYGKTNLSFYVSDASKQKFEKNAVGAFVLGKATTANGDNRVIPFTNKDLVITKSSIAAAAAKTGQTVAFSSVVITPGVEYTAIIIKKGVKFNERSKWTFIHKATATDTGTTIVAALATFINANPACGLTASASTTTLTVGMKAAGNDTLIKFTDGFAGVADKELVTDRNASGTYKVDNVKDYIKDLLSKGAADAGYRDTFRDNELYPGLFGEGGIDLSSYTSGAQVITLKFSEPSKVRTVEDDVNQIVQIVLPSSAAVDTAFDNIFA